MLLKAGGFFKDPDELGQRDIIGTTKMLFRTGSVTMQTAGAAIQRLPDFYDL